jgi:hypothetical protein
MSTKGFKRKFSAAILSADVVGYSRLSINKSQPHGQASGDKCPPATVIQNCTLTLVNQPNQ